MRGRIKTILAIALFFIFLIATGIGLYVIFFRQMTALPPSSGGSSTTTEGQGTLQGAGDYTGGTSVGGTGQGGSLPDSGSQTGGTGDQTFTPTAPGTTRTPQTVVLSQDITQALSPSPDGKSVRYYNPDDGKFYTVDTNGVIQAMSDKSFVNVDGVTWGNQSDQAIMSFPDGSNILYDFTAEKQSTLPKHWEDFTFSSDDGTIVTKSIGTSSDSRFLVLANPDGSEAVAIEPLGNNAGKTYPAWTGNGQIVAYAETGSAQGINAQEIILVGQNHENYQSLQVEGRGFEPLWSPSGNTVLYSVWTIENDYRPVLWVSGGAPGNMNENRRNLGVQTWAHKCTWYGETTVYCAVPEDMPTGAGLQPSLYTTLIDRIVKIDLASGNITGVGKPDGNLSIRNPSVTDDGKYLLFSDTLTGRLYSYRLY